ncbi:hypothetical protein ACQ4LE_008701 [Meloidogyne hapla]|uniref:Membrane lipoprotein n=1 Tax=Meloidogyne hapla TaxID=6305 RepID=A0A1I8B2R4_MELHA
MILSAIISIITITQLSTFVSSSSSLRLISHKTNPGVAAASIGSQELMDEWAPYRMAFLLILVASSVALWASYKLLCEHSDDSEEQQQRVISYQPLRQSSQLVLSLEGQEDEEIALSKKHGYKAHNLLTKNSSFSSFDDDDDDDLTCLLVGGEGTITAPSKGLSTEKL